MNYTLLALIGLIVAGIGIGAFLFLKWRRRNTPPEEPENNLQLTPPAQLYKLQKSEKFWGVSVESHCSASSRLAGIQFPFETAPHLPVRECEATVCNCSFIGLPERRHLADRRRGQDRRNSIRIENTDRRAERPRRKADFVSWQAYRHL